MKLSTILAVFAAFLILPITTHAQFFEDFESGTKGGYATGTVTLDTGSWIFNDALLGNANGDQKNDSQSARIRNGFIAMNFDKPTGAGSVSFFAANSGFSGDTGGKLQLEISFDSGSTWENAGSEVSLTDNLQRFDFQVNQTGDIRIRITKTAGGRVNVDDVRISDFEEVSEEPALRMRLGDQVLNNDDTISFGALSVGASRSRTIIIRNQGENDLVISDAEFSSSAFTSNESLNGSYASLEEKNFEIEFSSASVGSYNEQLTFATNDPEKKSITLNVTGEIFDSSQVISVSDARELEFGTVVTVTGWITVGNQFDGPAFLQDETAGIAVYYDDFHSIAEIGDSVLVTGPLTEFNPIGGTPGDFLLQIAANSENDVTFEIYQEGQRILAPTNITINAMNSGSFEGQLVQINNVNINHSGAFEGNTNYTINDGTGSGFIRIDNSTNIVNATAPEGSVNIIGVIDQFNGNYQLKPRFVEDLGVEEVTFPFEDVPKNQTLDVVTWNIEWFGSSSNGPDDVNTQFENVKTVITTIDADLYALQEIANPTLFQQLIDDLDEYRGFLAGYSQTQKTGYLFKHAVIDSLDSGLISSGQNSTDWAGRYPLMFEFDATIGQQQQRITAVNIHAKAFSQEDDFNKRVNASNQIKAYFDGELVQSNLIFLGDYNDDVLLSTFNNQVSPYQNFVDDDSYMVITKSLSERGFTSYRSRSNIDHITISSVFGQYYLEGTERVENVHYIGSYLSTTSDHFPVWTRFAFSEPVSTIDEFNQIPDNLSLSQNYPNPFNPTTNISFSLPADEMVNLRVYDVTGRLVATLINNQSMSAGSHNTTFDASTLSSGLYIYQLRLGNGQALSRKMMLVK